MIGAMCKPMLNVVIVCVMWVITKQFWPGFVGPLIHKSVSPNRHQHRQESKLLQARRKKRLMSPHHIPYR